MMEHTTRTQVIEKLTAYLHHRITLAALVDWAERLMMEGDFAAADHDVLRDVVARIGVADVRAFGLTWEECEALANRLGYEAEVTLRPSTGGLG
jgi:cobyrinic acid a,c-diamide synthase